MGIAPLTLKMAKCSFKFLQVGITDHDADKSVNCENSVRYASVPGRAIHDVDKDDDVKDDDNY